MNNAPDEKNALKDLKRDSFVVFRSWIDSAQAVLSPEDFKTYVLAIESYACDLVVPSKLPPVVSALFTLVRPTIDNNRKRWTGKAKGGQPGNQNAKKNESKRIETNQNESAGVYVSDSASVPVSEYVDESDCDGDSEPDNVVVEEEKEEVTPDPLKGVHRAIAKSGNDSVLLRDSPMTTTKSSKADSEVYERPCRAEFVAYAVDVAGLEDKTANMLFRYAKENMNWTHDDGRPITNDWKSYVDEQAARFHKSVQSGKKKK